MTVDGRRDNMILYNFIKYLDVISSVDGSPWRPVRNGYPVFHTPNHDSHSFLDSFLC